MIYNFIRKLLFLSIFTYSFGYNAFLYVVNNSKNNLILESLNYDITTGQLDQFHCLEHINNSQINSPNFFQQEFVNPADIGGNPTTMTVAIIKPNSNNVFSIKSECNINKSQLSDIFSLNPSDTPFTNIYAYRDLSVNYEQKTLSGFTAESSVNYLFSYMNMSGVIAAVITIL